eukprot:m51a1_g4102 hypothetical protein (414) ;mRNA; r:99956-101933
MRVRVLLFHRAWSVSEALCGVVSVRVRRPTFVATVGVRIWDCSTGHVKTFFESDVVACDDEMHAPYEASGAATELSAGVHEFPFSVGLPRDLPTSYRSPSGEDYLSYFAGAVVLLESGSTVESSGNDCSFAIVASGTMPAHHEETHTRCSSGGLVVVLDLAKFAALGGAVRGLVTVTNQTGHTASRTVLTLLDVEVVTGLLRHNLHVFAPVIIMAPVLSPPTYHRSQMLPAGCEEVTMFNGATIVLDHVARTVIGSSGVQAAEAQGSVYPNWQSIVLPPGWTVGSDQGETFFVNHIEGSTSWVDPRPPSQRATPASQLRQPVLDITALRGTGLLKPNAQCSVLQWRQNFTKPEKVKTEVSDKTLNPVWETNNVMHLEYNLRNRNNVVVYIKSIRYHIAGVHLWVITILRDCKP